MEDFNLFVISNEMRNLVDFQVSNVISHFPMVRFEEYIVIPRLNNTVMLRFSNSDIDQLSLNDLSIRENMIREIVSPDFLANFIGKDYSRFGLQVENLQKTLLNAHTCLDKTEYKYKPSYYKKVQIDNEKLNSIFGVDFEIWEYQVEQNEIELLCFSNEMDSSKSGNITFIPIKHDDSFSGIIKAQIEAISKEVSLCEVLLKYQ